MLVLYVNITYPSSVYNLWIWSKKRTSQNGSPCLTCIQACTHSFTHKPIGLHERTSAIMKSIASTVHQRTVRCLIIRNRAAQLKNTSVYSNQCVVKSCQRTHQCVDLFQYLAYRMVTRSLIRMSHAHKFFWLWLTTIEVPNSWINRLYQWNGHSHAQKLPPMTVWNDPKRP